MFCPDCSRNLDTVAIDDPCPGCGGSRRSAIATPATHRVKATAHNPTVVGESNYVDGSRAIQIGSVGYVSTGTSSPEGDRQEYSGRPAQNEEDVLEICHALREALGRSEIGEFKLPTGQEAGIDAVATRADDSVMRVQVTRVERGVWQDLARHGEATTQHDPIALADNIWAAIESKLHTAQRGDIVLALDARRAPGYLFDAVIDDFRDRHGESASLLGFEAVWLVGPAAIMTYRLA